MSTFLPKLSVDISIISLNSLFKSKDSYESLVFKAFISSTLLSVSIISILSDFSLNFTPAFLPIIILLSLTFLYSLLLFIFCSNITISGVTLGASLIIFLITWVDVWLYIFSALNAGSLESSFKASSVNVFRFFS